MHCIDWYLISCTFTPYPLLCFTMYWLIFNLLYIYSISFTMFYNELIDILSPVHLLRILYHVLHCIDWYFISCTFTTYHCYVLHCIDWYLISCTFTPYPLLCFTLYWLIFNLLYIYSISFTMFYNVLIDILSPVHLLRILYHVLHCIDWYFISCTFTTYPLPCFTMYWLIFYLLYIYYVSFTMFYTLLIDILSPVHLLRILYHVLHCIDWYFISCTFTTYPCYVLHCIDWYLISCTFIPYPLPCFTMYWLIFNLLYIYSISFAMFTMYRLIFNLLYIYSISFAMFYTVLIDI